MVDQARRKPATGNVVYQQGSAEALSLPNGRADLVFTSMVYSSSVQPDRRRIGMPSRIAKRWPRLHPQWHARVGLSTSTFLSGTRGAGRFRPPSRRDIEAVFTAGGFRPVVHQVVTQVTAPDWPSFIDKSALRADSFLARLSDDGFQQGMAALRTRGDMINQNDAVTEEIDWFVFLRHG